jgi:zinc transporter 1/2/3
MPLSPWLGWAAWLLSVLFTSIVISNVNFSVIIGGMSWIKSFFKATPTPDGRQVVHQFIKRGLCASGGTSKNYNVPFHVGGLFIILFVSTTACAFPILVIKFPRLRIPASFLFSAKHFGTGVLIATAFVHLLPTAFISLGNPCLSSFWTSDYPAMPGAIALAGIFFVTIIEMIFSPAQHACGGGEKGVNAVSRTEQGLESKGSTGRAATRPNGPDSSQMRNLGPLQGRKTSISRTLSWMEEENQRLDEVETVTNRTNVVSKNVALKADTGDTTDDPERNQHAGSVDLSAEQTHNKAVLQCLLLEMGILFHSIFIGMSLSVSVGSEFVILLIAIIFHRKQQPLLS